MKNLPKTNDKTQRKTKMKNFTLLLLVFICSVIIFSACNCPSITYTGKYAFDVVTFKNTRVRTIDNPLWAQKLDIAGVPNLHKVSDDLYRGAQPTKEGMVELKKLGIKTIINLRSDHSDTDELENIDIAYKTIPMEASEPKTEDVITFLNIINDSNNAPVFIHCRYGADRTGLMCAIYRIAEQNWSREEAIEEMTKGGYGFHSIWTNLADFIKKLDVEKIKQEGTDKNNQ
jgi:uncharacterized protein (TIGR01244 family)